MNNKGQFSIIAAMLVAVILVATVIVTYSTIRNSTIQNQPPILSAIDETNLAIKQLLGFTVGYYGSVLQVTGNSSYGRMLATNYLQSGLVNIVNMHPDYGASLNLSRIDMQAYWFSNHSYSTGNLAVTYNLTGLGIYGINYEASSKLTANLSGSPTLGEARINVIKDDGEPLANLGKGSFKFFKYNFANSTWETEPPPDEPTVFSNGTYLVDIPAEVDPYAYVVKIVDQRGIMVVASSFSQYTCVFNFSSAWNFTQPDSQWWDTGYNYRKVITITNNAQSALPSYYTALLTLDTASLVSAGKMQADGSDLRIVNWDGHAWVEIDRDIANMNTASTQLSFRTQAPIGPSPSASNDYYLYYDNSGASNPPANKSKIYLWYDDFNRPDEPDITASEPTYTKTNGGSWSVETNMLKNVGADGDPNKLVITALGTLNCGVEMLAKIDVDTWSANSDLGRMGLSCDIDQSNGEGYCGLLHNDQNSVDLLNDLRSWGTHASYSWTAKTWYFMRFRVIDPTSNSGKLKIWSASASEPTSWTIDGYFGSGPRGYGKVGIAGSRQGDVTYFDDLRVRYVVDMEPTSTLGSEENSPGLPRVPLTRAPTDARIVVELLQNGTMRCLGQSLNVTPTRPFPPIPLKAINVNETVNNMDSEVPFQLENWASDYRVPLGLANNASIFDSRTMLVFLVDKSITKVTIWWNGSDTATQTPNAYTNIYFKGDNINNNLLTNGLVQLQISGSFTLTSTVGSVSCEADFMRVNYKTPTYGSNLAYTIHHGVIRDIIHQEAEWSGGILDCANVYSEIIITLPAEATYYTYQLRLIFVNSTQNRNITDLCPLQLTTTITQFATENGTTAGYPIISNAAAFFFNYSSSCWMHHWSQMNSTDKGAGLMFTDTANFDLYAFDNDTTKTGGLRTNSAACTIELLPICETPVSFTDHRDITWNGAVVTFDGTTPIFKEDNATRTGLWILVEYQPTVTVEN